MELKQEVKDILDEAHYRYSEYAGCFDIVASRRGRFSPLLLKVLTNVDSLQFSQANNLKILSKNLDASAMLVGLHSRREQLGDNIIYERFEITTLTPKTLENILLLNELPSLYQFRGGLFAEIDSEKLREARYKQGLTQQQLADRVAITKKSVYEHENRRMRTVYAVAKKLEKALGCELTINVSFGGVSVTEKNSPDSFERRVSRDLRKIGFQTEFVHQSPFNIIAREKFIVFSDAAETKRIERDAPYLEGFSRVVKKPVIAITKEEAELDLPTIDEKELHELSTARELERIIKKR